MSLTQAQYADYQARFADGMARFSTLSLTPSDREVESYFSWRPCHVCGSKLGGQRMDCDVLRTETNEIETVAACWDCVYYSTYGQLDDNSMPDR